VYILETLTASLLTLQSFCDTICLTNTSGDALLEKEWCILVNVEEQPLVFLEPRDDFDRFILGVSSTGCVVYNQDSIICFISERFEVVVKDKDIAYRKAEQWFQFNFENACFGTRSPIFVSMDYLV